jgi:hypothetical protein
MKRRIRLAVSFAILLLSIATSFPVFAQVERKHRVIVLTDIEADPDDTQSLIRLLLYSNEIDLKGLVATTSVHQKTKVAPESIQKVIAVYGKVYPTLQKHAPGYPTAEYLSNLVTKGQPEYGINGMGKGKDSPGSDMIIKTLEENDDRPLWISTWGGVNTLAQALQKISATKSAAEVKRLVQKLRVYTISDQDDTGIWIRKNYPELFYIVSPGGYFKATWTGIGSVVRGINNETISNDWLAKNIQQGHGEYGALYPDVGYGMEGDTPAFLSLIPNGLNDAEHPDLGGWGGRYELYKPKLADIDPKGFTGGVPVEEETRAIWTNTNDQYSPVIANAYGRTIRKDTISFNDNKVTLWRWRDDFQNDFAARMDWTFMTVEEANHPPVPKLAHADVITVKSGDPFVLDAGGTSDPDGDNLSYHWFQYPEAGTVKAEVKFFNAENLYRITAEAPEVDKPETAHFILKVTDKGTPALSRYKRVVVKVLPK